MAHIPSVTLKETTHPPTHPLLLGSIALAALSGKDDAPHAFRKHLVPLQARYPHPALIPDCQRWAILKRIWRRSIVARVLSKHCFFPLFFTRFYARRFFVFSLTFFWFFSFLFFFLWWSCKHGRNKLCRQVENNILQRPFQPWSTRLRAK